MWLSEEMGNMESDDLDLNFNFSEYDFPFVWEVVPVGEIILKVGIVSPLAIIGIVGNCLLLLTILGNRSLKSPTNYLISNMALSDLLLLLLSPALFLTHEIFQSYKLGVIGCKLEGMIEIALLITSVITLCFVSYERLTAIAFPMQTRLTFHQTKIIITSTWIIGLVLSSPLGVFKYYQERQWKNFLEAFCTENIQVLPIYWHILIVAMFWIPSAVLIFCYTTIFIKLDQYEKMRRKRDHPLTISYKRKFAVTLFIVVCTFVVLHLPFTTLVFIRSNLLQQSELNSLDPSYSILIFTSHSLIYLNCALTPFIYGITNENFRRAFRQTKCYKYFSYCNPVASSISMNVYTVREQPLKSQPKLSPRTPIVTNNKKIFNPNWFKLEKLSKFSTKQENLAPKSHEKFQTLESFI